MKDGPTPLGWLGIIRLGLVQTALGAIVILTTSTLNRVMVVELAFPAILPGALVGLHYAMQMARPRLGHGSDVGGRRTPWIVGGMAVLALGGALAALAVGVMETAASAGIALAVLAFLLIGIGVGAAGTTLLVLLAKCVAPDRRAPAATIVWVMMIIGFIVTANVAGALLDPFSTSRLIVIATAISAGAFLLSLAAVWGVEGRSRGSYAEDDDAPRRDPTPFREALAQVWREAAARRFTIFVFVSMLAYSAQDLILEPFAGLAFAMTPGETTKLSGLQYSGVLAGMALVAILGARRGRGRAAVLRRWTVAGCIGSALGLFSLTLAGLVGPGWPFKASVIWLGFANGAFAVSAIGTMMGMAGEGRQGREGVRMGIWGAAQAIAFGVGGFVGAAAVDAVRLLLDAPVGAYMIVFALEAALFLLAARLGWRLDRAPRPASDAPDTESINAPAPLSRAREQGAV